MARLAAPPTFSRALRKPLLKPVAGSRIPRRVPIQSVKSKKMAKSAPTVVTRLPLKTSAPSRIAVSKASAALMRAQLARNVPAATPKGRQGACHGALLSISIDQADLQTGNAQKAGRRGTKIPRPSPAATSKSTKSPNCRVHRTTVRWEQVKELVEKMKKRTEAAAEAAVEEVEWDDSMMSFASDNNPDLLQDDSFNEDMDYTVDPVSQMGIFSRIMASTKAAVRGEWLTVAPVYHGDGLSRPRNRGRNVRS